MQAQEQEELSIEEKATLFQQLLEKRRKHFAAKRAEEKRNKPPTKDQQRKIMCTYLKNMEGYKLKDLKLKEEVGVGRVGSKAKKERGKQTELIQERFAISYTNKKDVKEFGGTWEEPKKKTKTTQHNEIASLKKRVKKIEKKDRSRTHRLKRLYKVGLTARVESSNNEESLGGDASKQGRINAIDAYKEISLVSVHDVNVSAVNAAGDIVSAASAATTVSAATTTTAIIKTVDDITLAQALEEMKSTKPTKKGVVIQELEPVKPLKNKDQIRLDEETTLNLQAEFDEEERLAREKAKKEEEANISLWDDMHAKIDVDHQFAKRTQAQEQEELSIKEKATFFQQLLDKEESILQPKEQKRKETN
ncbi:hypothetical protein Tco_0298461, partial [Tanacetum coccineum]